MRGLDGVKEAFVYINDDVILKLAVVYGTANAGRLLEKIKNGEKQYHFVEVMTLSLIHIFRQRDPQAGGLCF